MTEPVRMVDVTRVHEVQRITADEAVTALTAAAWTESISGEKYEAAVEAALKFCAAHEMGPVPVLGGYGLTMVSPADVRKVIEDEMGPAPRVLIHCFTDTVGCDFTLEAAVELARRENAQCAWAPNMFRHELAVYADGEMHRFDARRPAPDSPEGAQR
ncbi:MAG: hypothetical protein M3Y33_08550 [Actinomycetota bacterium]|nr:hypothetical protein [Actinomycetota bacterium]